MTKFRISRRQFSQHLGVMVGLLFFSLQKAWAGMPFAFWKGQSVNTGPTAWVWGYGLYGANGQVSSADNKSSPVQVGSLKEWSELAIVGNFGTTLGIKTNGTLWIWGSAGNGATGDHSTAARSSPVQVGGTTTWTLAAGGKLGGAFAIRSDKTLWAWGTNTNGVLGDGTTTNRSSPVQIGTLAVWSNVYTNNSTFAVRSTGTLWAWGTNTSGILGNNVTTNRSSPVQIGNLTTWSRAVGSAENSLGLRSDGTLWAWGQNQSGQLGDGTSTSRSSPIQVPGSNWTKIAIGSETITCCAGIKSDGTLWTWGPGSEGQSGIIGEPPAQVGTLSNWWSASIGMVSTGYNTILMVKTDGTLWGAGANASDQLGLGTGTNVVSPTQIGTLNTWSQPAVGYYHSFALKTTGALWGWGDGAAGKIGDGTTKARVSPIQVGALTTWSKMSAGNSHSMGLKSTGALWAWGLNATGQLGDNTTLNRSSPVQVGSLTLWSAMSAGGGTGSIAVHSTGSLWTWGVNDYGQLGNNSTDNRSSPVQIGAHTNWASVSASRNYSCVAVKSTGTLWTWGRNDKGQLGDGSITDRSSPVQVGTLNTWASAAVGLTQTLALKTDGTIWGWGENESYGEVGDATKTNRSSPVQIGNVAIWKQIDAGAGYSAALKSDGTLWTWGTNNSGCAGYIYRPPVQVGLDTTWSEISGLWRGFLALRNDSTLWAWGYGAMGQLGNSSIDTQSTPVQIGSGYSKISGSHSNASAIRNI